MTTQSYIPRRQRARALKSDYCYYPKSQEAAPFYDYSAPDPTQSTVGPLQRCMTQLNKLFQKKNMQLIAWGFVVLLLLYFSLGSNILAIVFSIIALLCFIPMYFIPVLGMEFGFTAMVVLSALQGFEVGFIVGKVPNILGHILSLDLDLDLVYEFFIYIPIAWVASLFSLGTIIPVGLSLIILYNVGYIIYFRFFGVLTAQEVSYALTNCVFNCVMLVQTVRLLQFLGF